MNRIDGSHPPRDNAEEVKCAHPFLEGMDSKHARQLLYNSELVRYQAGDVIFHEGHPADRFFLVQSGLIALETRVDGRSVQIDHLEAGDVLGWSWLFPPFAWHFQARVLEAAELIACDGSRLLVRCEEDSEFGYQLMKRVSLVLIKRLRATRKRLIGVEMVLNPIEASPPVH